MCLLDFGVKRSKVEVTEGSDPKKPGEYNIFVTTGANFYRASYASTVLAIEL